MGGFRAALSADGAHDAFRAALAEAFAPLVQNGFLDGLPEEHRANQETISVRTIDSDGFESQVAVSDVLFDNVLAQLQKTAQQKMPSLVVADRVFAQLRPQLEEIGARHDVPIVSVADIIAYRFQHENMIERVAETRLPTMWGDFTAIAYKSRIDPAEHVALVKGKIDDTEPVLVRVHSECLTGDVFGSLRCDCGDQLGMALQAIEKEGRGVFVYMRQEGRGIGLHNKIKAYALQDLGLDTVEANQQLGFPMDLRRYGVGAQILVDLGVRRFRFLTNNPKKVVGLEGFGLEMVERVPIVAAPRNDNRRYLETKRVKMGHLLDLGQSADGRS
jgi:GTP cyclohydrolase II